MMILTERLRSQIEKHMADEQAGFRKDRSTVQPVSYTHLTLPTNREV